MSLSSSSPALSRVRLLGLGALCASACGYVACVDDTTTPTPAPDGGTTTLDASLPDASTVTGDSAAPLADAAPDAPKEAGPWCGNIDGGAVCPTGEWRASASDGGAPTCKACPTTPIACATDFASLQADGGIAVTLPTYDSATKKLSITIPAGRQQIVEVQSAEVAYGTCFGSGTFTPQSVPATLSGDVITVDFAGVDGGTGSAGPCGLIKLTVKDACCTTSTVTVNAYWDAEVSLMKNPSCPDAG